MNLDPNTIEHEHEHAGGHFHEGEEAPPPGVRAMAIVRWLLVLAMAGIALASILYVYGNVGHAEGHAQTEYYCPMHPALVQDHPGECPICGMTLVPREHTQTATKDASAPDHAGHRHEPSDPYFCPMHPEETGKSADARCPLCGMKLQKRANASADAGQAKQAASPRAAPHSPKPAASASPALPSTVEGLVPVEIPAQRVQRIGMRTAKVTRSALPSELSAVGYVAPTESGLSVIQTRFSGWIEELRVAETGQLVQRGELLARVYSPELLSAQQELLNAQKWAAGPSTAQDVGALKNSARARLELMGMQPAEIDEVERSGTPHRLIEVRSPARGYVAEKNAIQGLFIQPGTRLFQIADLSKVWVLIELFEHDAGRIKVGQRARLELSAYPGESFSGKVQLVYPTLDPQTRTQRARVEFKNADLRLRPGMFGNVLIEQSAAEGLAVPREAVVDTGEQQYVFVSEGEGKFTPRPVKLGARVGELVQISAGLHEGETVVTTGNFLIDSESRLRATIAGKPGHEH